MKNLLRALLHRNGKRPPERETAEKTVGGNIDSLCETPHGKLYINEWGLAISDTETPMDELLVLLGCSEIYEVFATETSTVVTTRKLGRATLAKPLPLEDIILGLVEETGAKIDLKNPYTQLEYRGWRIFIQLEPAGQLELTATRIQSIPGLTELIDPLVAARLLILLLRPSTTVIVGPPGSGKTTLLNSLTIEAANLWPHLHIAVVEPVKELILPGGWPSRMVGNISELTRLTIRYKRPDILVVGELTTDDVWSFIEAGRSGVPTITTYHSPNIWKCLRSMADSLSLHIPGADESTVLRYIDLFILTRKTLFEGQPIRQVDSIYLSDGQRLLPIYTSLPTEIHLAEEDFKKLLPLSTLLGSAANIYEELKRRYHIGDKTRNYEKLPPLPLTELRSLQSIHNKTSHK